MDVDEDSVLSDADVEVGSTVSEVDVTVDSVLSETEDTVELAVSEELDVDSELDVVPGGPDPSHEAFPSVSRPHVCPSPQQWG